jgi:hypothetical protein
MNWILWTLLILVVLLLVAAAAAAIRYRRHIQGGWLMWRAFRKMKKRAAPGQQEIGDKAKASDSPLVRCAKCGKWAQQDEAVKLKSNFYCSHRCLEESFTAAV